jgi:hypothetical protein
MTTSRTRRFAALAFAAVSAAGLALPSASLASTFVAWSVTGVPKGDLLNVRAYPSPSSRIQVGYPNGTVLSMTGRCTGGVDLHDAQRHPAQVQRSLVRTQWCQVWHDPAGSGDFQAGWVYGRYIRPQ